MYLFSKIWIKQLLIAPVLILFLVYTLYPLIDSLSIAFFRKEDFLDRVFIGWQNFGNLFAEDYFKASLSNTLIYTVLSIVIMLPLAILLSLLLNSKFRLATPLKIITFAPNIVNGILTTLVWFFIVDPGQGVLNAVLKQWGMKWAALKWIGGAHLTPYTVTFLDGWKGIGFTAVLFYAALKMMPKEMFEAAEIDGASKNQQFFLITLPMLKETIKLVFILMIFGGLGTFQTFKFLTNFGPHDQSQTLSGILLQMGAIGTEGEARALGLMMFAISMAITIGILVLGNKKVDE